MKSLVLPQGHLSCRMEQNKGQLALVPEMSFGEGKEEFKNKLRKADDKSARMVDIYPFTDFDTIEVRCLDTQLSVSKRISTALLHSTEKTYWKKSTGMKPTGQNRSSGFYVND